MRVQQMLFGKIHRAFRGQIGPKVLALELLRRGRVSVARKRERANQDHAQKESARLTSKFARLPAPQLLAHFKERAQPAFLPGFSLPASRPGNLQKQFFPSQTDELIRSAERILNNHCWKLLGAGEKCFGADLDWHRDPLSGIEWPHEYHCDIKLHRDDGSDARVLWELNRLGHLITLSRAYAVTSDEKFCIEVFKQLESWRAQNPVGRGVNWTCAMEVALRAMNLLGVFQLLRQSSPMNEQTLSTWLTTFDQHARYIERNLEFSYIATSNHYLSDVVGLLWLGIMLPELEGAKKWRALGLRETLREMDKQVLPDGGDFESSTGYHRLALELFFYSFVLCRANEINIEERYWQKLRKMMEYCRSFMRPDGMAPLVGDTDSGQVFPIINRSGNDQSYILALGSVVFEDPHLKPANLKAPDELLWILGEAAVREYEPPALVNEQSRAFPDAGTFILRDGDLYLLLNASGAGINGRGSHGHNDALSVEVSACGRAFLVDPGTYVYTADLHERHLFRSTAYHSTVEIDKTEQNTTLEQIPFVIGDEAHPRCMAWQTGAEVDRVAVEHDGYERLREPVRHRRSVTFYKKERWWLIDDELIGTGEHDFAIRFHFDTGLEVNIWEETSAVALDRASGARLLIVPINLKQQPDFEPQFTSSNYGEKKPSVSACWNISASAPCRFRWALVPICAGEVESERLELIAKVREAEKVPSQRGSA